MGNRVTKRPEETAKLGPKMCNLPNDQWRSFVIAYVSSGTGNATAALKQAGREGTPVSLRVAAHHLLHDTRVQEAIQEEARKRLVSFLPLAINVHKEIMQDAGHKDRLNAAAGILNRAGLHVVTEEKRTVEVTFNPEQLARAKVLSARLGVPLEKLVGSRLAIAGPKIEDAEFEEKSE